MRVILMHNPKGGRGKHSKKDLMNAQVKAGHHAIYRSTKKTYDNKALKKSADLVIAAGGDGTVRKVACELMDTGIPLSVLPLGTANNLARSLGFVGSTKQIIARLEGGKKRPFDVGVAQGQWGKRYFFESVGGVCSPTIFPILNGTKKRLRSFPKNRKWHGTFQPCPNVA